MDRENLADQYARLWEAGGPPPDVIGFLKAHPRTPLRQRVDVLVIDQRQRWRMGDRRPAEDYLREFPEIAGDPELLLDLVYGEYSLGLEGGNPPDPEPFLARFPGLRVALMRQLEVADWMPKQAAAKGTLNGTRAGSVPGDQTRETGHPASDRVGAPGQSAVACSTDAANDAGAADSGETTDILSMNSDPMGTGATWDLPLSARPDMGGPEEIRAPASPPGNLGASPQNPSPTSVDEPERWYNWQVVPGYEAHSLLGRGGMGVVYKALDLKLNRLVALKMIRDGSHALPEHLTRFRIEAEAVARLHHPNILQIYQIGEYHDLPFVALELLEGGTLAKRLANTPQPLREAARLLATLARAMQAAHQAGIVHRDLKPSNVLFDRAGTPKVADFGLAKRLEIDEGETRTGQVMGTPSYMAPEQAEGRVGAIGPAADIYALGAILYETLTGRPPFKGTTTAETLMQVLHEDPVPPSRLRPRLPRDLETICLKCLAKEPSRRFADATALAEDLDRYLAGEPIHARRTPLWERGLKWSRRRPMTTAIAVFGLAVAGTSIAVVLRAENLARAEEQSKRDTRERLRRETELALFDGQRALAQGRWDEVQEIVSRPLSRIESEPLLADLRARTEHLLEEAKRGLRDQRAVEEAREHYRRFIAARDEALFLDTRFTGLDMPVDPAATCRAAREALAVFGAAADGAGDQWTLPSLPAALEWWERSEIEGGFYELLLILAGAVSESPGPDPDPAPRADRALRILDRAALIHPSPTRAYHLRRAACLARKRDTEGAARARAEAERLAPTDAFDFFLSGQERARREEWKKAIQDFDAALQREPDHFWAQCLLAICHIQTQEPLKARPSLTACLQRKPDTVWLYLLRGFASAQAGNLALGLARRYPDQAAALEAEAASQLDAAEADYRTALVKLGDGPGHAELRYVLLVNRGQIRLERRDLAPAAADLDEAIRLDDRHTDAYVALGQVYQRQGRTDEALAQFDQAIRLRPEWAPLYRGRAEIVLGLAAPTPDQRAAALHDLGKAIRLEAPGNPLIAADLIRRAALLHQDGRDEEALADCESALKVHSSYAPAHRLRIKVLLSLKRYDDLIRSFDVALAAAKPSADLYELRGMARDHLDDHEGAIADYTLALTLAPDSPRVLARRGWSYLVTGAARPAFRDFDAAIRLDPSEPDAYNGRGNARVHLGQYREAVLDAELALKQGEPTWRVAYNAARIYAQAAASAIAAERDARVASLLATRDQDRSLALLRLALDRLPAGHRPAFWRDSLQRDPALQSIRRRLRTLPDAPTAEPPGR